MKNIILVFTIIFLFITSACENKIKGDALYKSDDIQQIEQAKQTEQAKQPEQIEQIGQTEQEPQDPNLQWPKDFIPGVPILEGKIISLNFDVPREGDEVQEPQYVRIELVNMEEDVVDKFIEGLKIGGFTQNAVYEKNEHHTKYYVQELKAGYDYCRVLFKWNSIDKSAFAVLLKPGFLALSSYLFSYDDTTDEDLFPWPEDFIQNYPEPKGKIIDVCFSEVHTEAAEGTQYDIMFYYGDRQSVIYCIEEMKKVYYMDADEIITENFIMYFGVSSYRDIQKHHHVYIGYEDISDSPYISMLKAPEGKFRIINVTMFKDK
jgi:hypothetical protein